MVVLQFAFDPDDPTAPHHPRPPRREPRRLHRHARQRHGRAAGTSRWTRARARVDDGDRAAGVASREPHWSLIRLAFGSPARLAMVQAQDVLGLGSEARMNVPGRAAARGSGACASAPALARAPAARGERDRGPTGRRSAQPAGAHADVARPVPRVHGDRRGVRRHSTEAVVPTRHAHYVAVEAAPARRARDRGTRVDACQARRSPSAASRADVASRGRRRSAASRRRPRRSLARRPPPTGRAPACGTSE